nr:hypothetical protein CFP56_01106 [Quercus suber]
MTAWADACAVRGDAEGRPEVVVVVDLVVRNQSSGPDRRLLPQISRLHVLDRCHRMQRECVPAIPKPRKRRATNGFDASPPRGSQGIPLADILDHRSPLESNAGLHIARPLPATHDVVPSTVKESLLARHDLSHNGSASFRSLLSYGLGLDPASFARFRRFAAEFPFIFVRADANAIHMATHRPVLTLAICIVAAAAHAPVQKQLVHAFRLALSSKAIIAAERNLDLLLGLLAFTAWQHHYTPRAQLYQDLCLLAGMATDLGLYRPRFRCQGPTAPEPECQGAFIGSYYLCTGLSIMALGKPSPMRGTENLHQCARMVAQYERPLANVVSVLEAVRLVEEFDDVLRSELPRDTRTLSNFAELHVKNMLHRLKALKREDPQLGATHICPAIAIHLHHRLLRATDTLDSPLLIQCACAIKEYLDDMLARDPATLHHLAILDYANLCDTLLLLLRISSRSFPSPTAATSEGGWEAGAIASMLQPETIVAALLAHVDRAPATNDLTPRSAQNFARFRAVCDAVHQRLATEAHSPTLTSAAADARFHGVGNFRPSNHVSPNPSAALSAPRALQPAIEEFPWGVLDEAFWTNVARHGREGVI